MPIMKYKTKGNALPSQKPRVYFTCHPEDFRRHFKKICDDIFKTHDCAIYYTEDMNEPIPDQEVATDLGSNNLFVVAVTSRLLTQPNRAMDFDIPYAFQENIPLLPIAMELGLDVIYSQADKFGKRQYLYPYGTDNSEVPYAEKLKKYLDSVLISNETATRIRNAFDAHIFLSYRKKDRRHANELMRLIHRDPALHSTAIWYDEYLTPGESFIKNIDAILNKSDLFSLVVTRNILEEPDGNPNFVMGHEYPAARASGIPILPVAMEETCQNTLCEKFKGLPECINVKDPNLQRHFSDALKQTGSTENRDAEHTYLVGLAYLDGIDVEVNRELGLAKIMEAAQAELPEAMSKLFWMYMRGNSVRLDYQEAVKWGTRLVDYYLKGHGEDPTKMMSALLDLVSAYNTIGNHSQALATCKNALKLSAETYGKNSPMNFPPFRSLTETYFLMGDYQKCATYSAIMYDEFSAFFGKEDPHTINILSNLAKAYDGMGDYSKAIELQKQAYFAFNKVNGTEHPYTLNSLTELAITYNKCGDHFRSIELLEQVYATRRIVLGEKHPDTLSAMNNMTVPYSMLGIQDKAIPLLEKSYQLHLEVFGAEHPDTIRTLSNMANFYGQIGQHQKSIALKEKAYRQFSEILGSEHHDTLRAEVNLAIEHSELGNHVIAFELLEKTWSKFVQTLGIDHPDAQLAKAWMSIVSRRLHSVQQQNTGVNENALRHCQELRHQMDMYRDLDNMKKALELSQRIYDCLCESVGERHPETIRIMKDQIDIYCQLNQHKEALQLAELAYKTYTNPNEKANPDMIAITKKLAYLYKKQGSNKKAAEIKNSANNKASHGSLFSRLFQKK